MRPSTMTIAEVVVGKPQTGPQPEGLHYLHSAKLEKEKNLRKKKYHT
jgi:hypothetical protein